jgi:hypothetical protein
MRLINLGCHTSSNGVVDSPELQGAQMPAFIEKILKGNDPGLISIFHR